MAKKSVKVKAPAKKAVEQKVKTVKFEKEPIAKEENNVVPVQPAVKPLSKAEMARRKKAYDASQKELATMMENHHKAMKKKKDDEFNAGFKKAENKLEIYFFKEKDGESMDMRVTGFESPSALAGVLALMLGKVTGR